jgi:hypothetical protein
VSSYRSIALILITVFGVLFSLLYSSSLMAIQNNDKFYQILASKRADIEVYRLRTPQNICFDMDSERLKQIDQDMAQEQVRGASDTLSRGIRDADRDALSYQEMERQMVLPKEYFEQMGNRYTGEGLRLEQQSEAMLPLIQTYESKFNHTVIHRSIRGVSDDVHQYHCNFGFNGSYYGISIKFYSLSSLNEYAGYLPIAITNQQLLEKTSSQMSENNVIVYRMFNNTAVWINESDSWLTLQLSPATLDAPIDDCCGELEPITVRLAPSAAWDVYLGPNLGRIDTTFHYQIKEYPWIQGNIILKNYPVCMDYDIAASLYSQTRFPFKVPSHLPSGFEYKCMQAEAYSIKLFYANRTFNVEEMGEGTSSGMILLRMSDDERFYGINEGQNGVPKSDSDKDRVMQQYQSILEGNPALNPQLIDINGRLAWGNEASPTGAVGTVTFPDGSEIVTRSSMPSRLRLYENGTMIHLEGYIPLEELAKIARSINYY